MHIVTTVLVTAGQFAGCSQKVVEREYGWFLVRLEEGSSSLWLTPKGKG